MGWEHYQTVDPLEKEPQGLFGVRLLILHFKFQFSKSMKSSTFHIFLNLTYPFRKNISFTKCPKFIQKFTQNCKALVNVLSGGIWRWLKRERDIGIKATLSDVKTAFRWNPALKRTTGWRNDRKIYWYEHVFLFCYTNHYIVEQNTQNLLWVAMLLNLYNGGVKFRRANFNLFLQVLFSWT